MGGVFGMVVIGLLFRFRVMFWVLRKLLIFDVEGWLLLSIGRVLWLVGLKVFV